MAAPVFQNSTSGSTSFAASITRALNAGTAAKRCVLVFATNQSSNTTTPTGATYGGVAMTAGTLFTCSTTGNQGRLFWLFGDANVASGTNNIVVTYSTGNGKPDILALAYSGVDDTAGVYSQTTATRFSSTPSWVVASAVGDIVVALWAASLGGAPTPTSPAVARVGDPLHTYILDNVAWEQAGAASVTIGGTIAGPTPAWFGTAVSLKAAPSGPATAITLSGPTSGTVNVASGNFTVAANGSLSATVNVTPSDGGGGGSFTPAGVALTAAAPSATFTYTPASVGTTTISVTNDAGLTNPGSINYVSSVQAATALTMSGPSGGAVGVASTNFSLAANGAITGTVVVTPNDSSGGGSFTPTTVSLTAASPTGTFTYTPASAGTKTIRTTNNGGLTNPTNLAYAATVTAGAITTDPICNNTGTLLVSQTGATVYVYAISTGALVVAKTGQTTNTSGVMVIADPAIAAGTTYRVVGVLSGGAEFMARYTAA